MYAPPKNIYYNNWRALLDQLQGPILLGGDFNAHPYASGCTYQDKAGTTLTNNINQDGIIILNNGQNTMIPIPRLNRASYPLDITLATSDISHLIEWDVYQDPMGSDNYTILMKINCNIVSYINKKK